jgi:hypothetical protein
VAVGTTIVASFSNVVSVLPGWDAAALDNPGLARPFGAWGSNVPHNDTYSVADFSVDQYGYELPSESSPVDAFRDMGVEIAADTEGLVTRILSDARITGGDVVQRLVIASDLAKERGFAHRIELTVADEPGIFSGVTAVFRVDATARELVQLNMALADSETTHAVAGTQAFDVAFSRVV